MLGNAIVEILSKVVVWEPKIAIVVLSALEMEASSVALETD